MLAHRFYKCCWDSCGHTNCCVRFQDYHKTVADIAALFAEAQKDFPELKAEETCVFLFCDLHCEHKFGIIFRVSGIIPADYHELEIAERHY